MDIRIVKEPNPPLPKENAHLFIAMLATAILYVAVSMFVTYRARMKAFNRGFMRQFDEINAKTFPGKKAPQFGYPDSGNGYFGRKLPYADWYKMQCGQNIQYYFFAQITFVLLSCFVGGIYYPKTTLYTLCVYLLGRLIAVVKYARNGPT